MFDAAKDIARIVGLINETKESANFVLKLSPNYTGIEVKPSLESEILYDMKRIYNDPSKIQFDDGAYDVRLGPFDKEYIVRIKDNLIISCDKYIKRTIPFIPWAKNPYESK